jgi:HEAT repeat protein
MNPIHLLLRIPSCLVASACLLLANQARAYVDLAPTLVKIMSDSQKIQLVEVVRFDEEKHLLVLKGIRALKGDLDTNPIQHDVAPADSTIVPRVIQQWAEPGARGVLFISRTTELLCLGEGWYPVRSAGNGGWKLSTDRADLPLAYYGTVSRLADGIALMLAGKNAVLTTVQHGVDDAASFDVALNRASMPGLMRVQRIRANMSMPTTVMAVSANPAYLIGRGRVGEEDLPSLLVRLKDSDASVRAGAADELRDLGRKAAPAEPNLSGLLTDRSPSVRFESAATLLCINKDNKAAVEVHAKGLTDSEATVRRAAARAVGHAGPGAAPLIDKLALLLKDTNESVRVSALQAIALLGSTAASAAPAVVPLLDAKDTCIDAADALGRIGPRARPVPKRLVEMLASDETAVQWAAVRSMAQIGGKEAHPAVEFIVSRLNNSSEINTYNMMIYLALLGPDATDAISAAQNARLGHPVIPSATVWAIRASGFPWQTGGGRGGFGGRGGPGGPGGGGPGGPGFDLGTTMYEAYIRELGERLRPLALTLVQQLVEGTAGDVPTWGYKLLACAPEESTSKLSVCLADSDQAVRERAAVAMGYMGSAAYPAKEQVSKAISKASTEQERRLMEWCLSEISL